MLKVLVVAVLALVLAGGAWALFLREEDQGHPLVVGALEDGVKLIEPEIADQRVELAAAGRVQRARRDDGLGTRDRRSPTRGS